MLNARLKLILLFLAGACFAIPVAADDFTPGEKLFALTVKPLFAAKCMACHGDDPEDLQGGFDLRSRESLLAGGDSFGDEVVVLGEAEKSFLYRVTTREEEGFEMPPKEADQLTQQQTWSIRDWIKAGAPWPDEDRIAQIQYEFAEGVMVQTSGGLGDDWTNRRYKPEHLWAYRPIVAETVPESQHPIDWFINRKLEAIDLAPAPNAKPIELARRLSFGLTGLPPEPKPAVQFSNDFDVDPQNAVEEYARRLMATPQYGEHFGRHWLDVARYADSAGFANDYARPNAWRYRDYVVRSFNDDRPYDEFVKQQIAGDELDSSNPENLVATGFLRMGAWEQTGMSVFRLTRQQWLDDVTDSVGQAFLAHPLQCAKCHDHKFDPIPTRDYYSMLAVFSTTQFVERDAPFLDRENKTGFVQAHQWTKAKIAAYQGQRDALKSRVEDARKLENESLGEGNAKVGDNGLDPGDEASLARMGKNIERHTWELDKTKPIAFAVHDGTTVERNNVKARISMPTNPWREGNKKLKVYLELDTILTGGDAFTRGDPVTPAPISAAVNLGDMETPEFPAGQGQRRLALANWIVDQQNPLTARVIVNRVWAWHFGAGLAGNPNNFGATGKLPTHPALLDYLASWFVSNGWSVKKLNQLIVTSETYRRSSRHPNPDQLESKDPLHKFYATHLPRRLSAEELRDAMLFASGELNRQVGGIPCRPDINEEVAMQPRQIMGGTASVYEPDPQPKQRNRRSLYAEKIRGLRDPFLESFNQPGPDKSCELRETSTVAPQALTLFNSEEVHDRALAFADRLMKAELDDKQTVMRAFELSLGRPATEREFDSCLQHWNAATNEEQSRKYESKTYASQIKRTVMAEKTGEPYEFVEHMPTYDVYVPDLKPDQADAKTRGLAQVCLVIFNLNEFVYVD